MSEKINVLIADDHPIVRQGMEMLLDIQDDIDVLGVVENGQQAVAFVKNQPPDVILMDLNMPLLNGIDATKQIRAINSHTKVIVLTSHHQDAMVFPAIKAGALSYLLKSAKPSEVVEAIRAAARGEARLHPRVAQRLMQEVSGARVSAESLTPRELDVLKQIAKGNGNKTIAKNLFVSEKTVKTHVSNILSKLNLDDRTQVAIYALKQGIVPLDED